MNVLFLSIGAVESIEKPNLYTDLLRQFRDQGHNVYLVTKREKRTKLPTELVQELGANILFVRVGNITQCGFIEKGISTLRIQSQYKKAIKKHFSGVKFDLILYTTPPITLGGLIGHIKKRDNAKTYLLLKDIFPQNAVDIGVMSKSGLKGLLYKYFRKKEKKLYALSDRIGCMSPANVDFVLKNNLEVPAEKVEVCPNCIEPIDMSISTDKRIEMREKYGIPLDKKVFVYGGNLGKPQGIPFLIECLKTQQNNEEAYFLIVGAGTEYSKIETYINEVQPHNVKLLKQLPKEDYDRLVAACDVGMIFLDYRFTIPNFPSRLLSYMQAKLPVLCATDSNTDIGKIATENGFGWWCESNSVEDFDSLVKQVRSVDLKKMGQNAWNCLLEKYTVQTGYEIIMKD